MKKQLLVRQLMVFLMLVSCSEGGRVTPLPTVDQSYYPLAMGDFREYSVMEVSGRISAPDTSWYFLREQAGAGEASNYLISFAIRDNMNDDWDISGRMIAGADASEVVEVLENNPIVKVRFPAGNNRWDSNVYSAENAEFYAAELIDVDSLQNAVLKVVISELPVNALNEVDSRFEYYSAGIGLISRDFVILDFQNDEGLVIKQNIIRYGNE